MSALTDLYDAVDRGEGEAWLAAHPEQVTPDTGRAAVAEAFQAHERGDARTATTWALAAETVLKLAGEQEGFLKVWLRRLSWDYLAADTPEEYEPVREVLLRIADAADSAGYPPVAGEARITAADCSFWAHAGLPEVRDETEERLARQLLEDTAAAWEGGAAEADEGQIERLATLTVEVFTIWLERTDFYYDDEMKDLAARVVRGAHALVPHDAFGRPDGAMRRSLVAQTLTHAAIRLDLGVPTSLAQRLLIAMTTAAEDGQHDAWAVAARVMLVDTPESFDRESLNALRQAFYDAQDPRAGFRSRLGRLVQAARLDELVGEDLAHLVVEEDPDVPQIFRLTEVASARTLLDGLDGMLTTPDDEQCRTLERAATDFPPSPDDDVVTREMRLVSELPVASEDVLAQLETRYGELGAGYAGAAEPGDLSAVQQLLRPGEVMLRYVLPHKWSHPAYLPGVLVVTAADATYVSLPDLGSDGGTIGRFTIDGRSPLDASALGTAVMNARLALSTGDPAAVPQAEQHLSAMDELLFGRVRETGLADGCDHWIVVPQRSLHLVPWMALRNAAGRWLLDDAAVTVVPSGSVWSRLRQRPPGRAQRLGMLADPLVGYAGLPQLPGAMEELEQVVGAWQKQGLAVDQFAQEEATFEALSRAAASCDVLQVAAHGSFPGDGALFDHQLLLSPDAGHSGPVTADALRGLDLSAVACVVLSVCDGGAYRVGRGDEPYGLVPALLEAGANSVVAAQWAVDDDRARALMSRTGELLAEHAPAEALRQACIELRESAPAGDWTHAAFVAVGG